MATKVIVESFCDVCSKQADEDAHTHHRPYCQLTSLDCDCDANDWVHDTCCTRCVQRATVTAQTCHCGSDTIGHVHTKGAL